MKFPPPAFTYQPRNGWMLPRSIATHYAMETSLDVVRDAESDRSLETVKSLNEEAKR